MHCGRINTGPQTDNRLLSNTMSNLLALGQEVLWLDRDVISAGLLEADPSNRPNERYH